jgi:hypothetical protein
LLKELYVATHNALRRGLENPVNQQDTLFGAIFNGNGMPYDFVRIIAQEIIRVDILPCSIYAAIGKAFSQQFPACFCFGFLDRILTTSTCSLLQIFAQPTPNYGPAGKTLCLKSYIYILL